jgi:hypothetical protein
VQLFEPDEINQHIEFDDDDNALNDDNEKEILVLPVFVRLFHIYMMFRKMLA